MGGKLEVKAEELASRLTSLSVLGFGVGIKPKETERSVIRELFIFLEDRRALCGGAIWEEPNHVLKSVLKIREELTSTLKRLKDGSGGSQLCFAMRAGCREFLNSMPEKDYPHAMDHHVSWQLEHLLLELGRLRAVFGQHIAALAYLYRIDVTGDLVHILPPVLEGKTKAKKKALPKKG